MTTATRWRHVTTAFAVVMPVIVLGPALGKGFVLSYDMVWVPDLSLRATALGLGTGLPRAVPSDAVVAVLDTLVPGMLLQKAVLLGGLILAGLGARLLAGPSPVGQLVAMAVYVWNPFVAERLWIGHWPLLVGYAVLPWVAVEAARFRRGNRSWAWVGVWLPWGCLSPSAGVITAVMALVAGLSWTATPGRGRRNAVLLAMTAVANGPWMAAGLIHAGSAVAGGTDVFALGGEGHLPRLVAALTLGGIWNTEVVPASRAGWGPWLALAFLVVLAAVGLRRWWRRERSRLAVPLVVSWALGLGFALAPVVLPGPTGWLADHVPGAALMRDSSRFLALCAPLLAALAAAGADRLVSSVKGAFARTALAVGLILLPVMVLPDLAWGVGGALRPTEYPSSYADARQRLADAAGKEGSHPGDVVILPFTSYRAPAWNGGRKVLAPLGRILTPDDVTSDELIVSGRVLPGEDPRAVRVRAALAEPTPIARSAALLGLGISYAAIEPGFEEPLAGHDLLSTPDVRLVQLEGGPFVRRSSSSLEVATMACAWGLWVALALAAPVDLLRARFLGRRRGRRQ